MDLSDYYYRKMCVAAQEQKMLCEWDSKYILPGIKDFYDIVFDGVDESWKVLLSETFIGIEYKLYHNVVNHYFLLVVSIEGCEKFADLSEKFADLSEEDLVNLIVNNIKELLKFKRKQTLLITGHAMGGYLAQYIAFKITYCNVDRYGLMHSTVTPTENFVTYTVVFDSPPAFERVNLLGFLKCRDINLAITNVISPNNRSFKFYTRLGRTRFRKRIKIREILFDRDAMTYKENSTYEGLVEWDRKEIPASFFTNSVLEQLREYMFIALMCPELVEKIPNFRLLDSCILLEDENLTPEEFFPRMHQVLSKFEYVIYSKMLDEKQLKELYEVLTEKKRKDSHCFIMNEEGKGIVQGWPDGNVIRGCQSYKEMRFYACLYSNSIKNCYYCSYEKFSQISSETINNFASKTNPTIILIVIEKNIQIQHKSYKNMKIFYLVLEHDVLKTNNTLHFSILEEKSQNRLKSTMFNYFGNRVEAWEIFGSHLFQELRIFEIHDFRLLSGTRRKKKICYLSHEIYRKNSTEIVGSAFEMVHRIINKEFMHVVILSKVGMGKSTTLRTIAYELQIEQPQYWFVNLEPSQINCQLGKEKPTLNSKMAAIEFIRNLELSKFKGNKEVPRKLFYQKVKMNEMFLLIDSLDKISPKYRDEVNHLIELLRHTGLQMIVTSCPLEGNNFRDEETFELEQFNNNEKSIKFIEKVAKRLLNKYPLANRVCGKNAGDIAKTCSNNPFSMFLAVYFYTYNAVPQGRKDKLDMNIRDLKGFLKMSIEETCDDLKIDKSNALKKYDHLLEILAVHAIFHDGEVKDEYKCKISKNGHFINRFGIAKLENDYKKVFFLHAPFADFLVARIFIQQHAKISYSPRLSTEQQKSVLLDKKHVEIRQIICGLLKAEKVEIAYEVIQGNEKKLLQLLIVENCVELYFNLKEKLKVAHENYFMETSDSHKLNLLYLALEKSSEELVKQLLDDGAAFGSVLQEEFVLHKAVEKRLNTEVQLNFNALKKGINKADGRGYVPLHYAAMNKCEKMVEFLIANGAFVNLPNASNKTALYFSIQANSEGVVNLLLEKKADKKFALKWSVELGRRKLFEEFYEQDTNEDGLKETRLQEALFSAAASGDLKFCQRLHNLKGKTTTLDENGETSVHLAAAGGHLECLQVLLKDVANVDVRNSKGETLLMKALLHDEVDVVEWLFKKNADLQAEDAEGTKVSHFITVFVLSKTMSTEERNDLKRRFQSYIAN